MTSTGPTPDPDPSELPPAAPYAAPYVPPQQPAPATTPWPAAQVPPQGGPPVAWPASEPPGAPRGAQQYLDQTRSFVRGVSERVRAADQSQLVRRGREAGMRQMRQVRSSVGAIDPGRIATNAGEVGRTAAAHGARAARRTVSAVGEFGTGLATFWRGLWEFVKRPRLWLYALLPAAILYALTLASEAAVTVATRRLAEWVAGFAEGWWSVLRWAIEWTVHWGVGALAYTVMGFLVIPSTLIVGAPFYVLVVRSLERRLDPAGPPPASGWASTSVFVMSQTVLLTLVVMFGGLVAVPVLLIPGVNLLAATVIAVVLNGFVVGLIAVGLPLHHHGVTGRRDHFRYAWRNRWAIVGFGGMSVLVLGIPFAPLRWLSVPAVFVGAVLLQRGFPAVPSLPPTPAAPPPHVGWPPSAGWSENAALPPYGMPPPTTAPLPNTAPPHTPAPGRHPSP